MRKIDSVLYSVVLKRTEKCLLVEQRKIVETKASGFSYVGPCREIYHLGPGENRPPAEYVTEIQYPLQS
jgi:effector-binding domain-containing protein